MEKRLITRWRMGLILVFAVSVLLYLPSLIGGAIWDDFDLISGAAFGGNSLESAFTRPFLGHYFRPLTSASFVLESSVAKATPFYYHQTNILLHAIAAVLVACLAFAISKKELAGVLAGLFFAAQPWQVGAVAWIGGRTDALSTAFLAAFLVSLVLYHQTTKPAWLVSATITFFLAALSKEQALAVLPAIPLSVFVFGSKKWSDARKLSIPFLIVLVVYVVLWAIDAPPPAHAPNGFFATLALGCRTTAMYGLGFITPNHRALLTWTLENYQGWLWITIGAALIGVCGYLFFYCWKHHRPIAWVAICGLLVYLPISNFPTVPSFVVGPYRCAEAGTAVACLFGIGCAWTLNSKRWIAAIPFAGNFVAGIAVTWWGVHLWSSPGELFGRASHNDPHFIVGVGNYANQLDADLNSKEGLKWTNEVLTWLFATPHWHDVLKAKKTDAFTPEVNLRLTTNSGNPDRRALGWFLSSQAGILSHLNRISEAVEVEKDALHVYPKDARTHYAYGRLIVKFDRKEAIAHWAYALSLMPRYGACITSLAHERLKDHQYAEVIRLITPVFSDIKWDSEVCLDLADAKIALKDYAGATAALDAAEKSFMVKAGEVTKRRTQLKELQSAPRQIL